MNHWLSETLFKLEMKRSFKSLLIWSAAMAGTMILVIVLYPIAKDMFAAVPPEFQSFIEDFGGIPTNILEYYATEGAMMLQIFGGIYAAMEGFNAIARDEREKTVETLYQLPLKRRVFFFTKLFRASVNLIIFSMVTYVLSMAGFVMIGESFDIGLFTYFFVLNMVMYLMLVVFGLTLSVFLKKTDKSFVSVMIPFGFYIISLLAMATDNEWLTDLKYLTPFTFCNPVEILKENAGFETLNFVIFVGLTILAVMLSLRKFKKHEFIV